MSDRAARRALQEQQRRDKALAKLSPAATEVILLRHGETDWNREHRLQGQDPAAPGLNEAGRAQSVALAKHFLAEAAEGKCLDAIYSSDLARALETAEAIASPLGIKVQQSQGLAERRLGVLQGLSIPEAAAQQPQALAVFQRGRPEDCIPGGGESLTELAQRAVQAVGSIAAQHPGGRILLVVHGGILHVLHAHVTGSRCAGRLLNGSLGAVMVEGPVWVLLEWNKLAHMAALGLTLDEDGFGGCSKEA